MAWLNYHHLLYFWTVARTGSVTRACQELHLTQPAVSSQIKALERSLGAALFVRRGRTLVLTEFGRVVFRYAEEIFLLGREMQEALAGRAVGRAERLNVGVADQVPKQIIYRVLEPVLRAGQGVKLVVREDGLERLLGELSMHNVDLVIADAPSGSATRVRAFNHLLGETDVTLFGTPELARKYRRRFPESLNGAPMLMPTSGTQLHRSLSAWFDSKGLHPVVVGEIEDSALLKMFGEGGVGLFPAPSAVSADLIKRYGVRPVGRIPELRERFFAISAERRITHPLVKEITERAQLAFA